MTGFLETLINWVLRVYQWFIFWEILLDFQRGVVLRLGRYHRPAEPGWNWRLPFGLEGVLACNVVPTTTDLPPQAIVTKDGETALVEVVIMWGISSPRRFLLEIEDAISVLSDAGAGTIHDVASGLTWEELNNPDVDVFLTQEVKERAKKWGMRVMSVQIISLSRLGMKHGSLRISHPSIMT